MNIQKELYRLVDGTTVYTLTSADEDEIYNGETYISTTLDRDEIENKNELSKANVTLTVSLDNEMGRNWMTSILDRAVTLTIFSKFGDDVSVIFKGRLSAIKPDSSTIGIVFESISTSLRRLGLRMKYQRNCPHVLYGLGCNLDKDEWGILTEITNVDGVTLTATKANLHSDGYYLAGMVKGPDDVFRFIINHEGQTLTLIRALDDLFEGLVNKGYGYNYGKIYGGTLTAFIYPGCDRSKETCFNKFDNLNNNGAFPFISNNPFAGKSIV